MLKPIYLALALALTHALPMHSQAAPSADQAKAAVQLIVNTYVPNPLAKVEGSKTGLPKDGTWGARPATGAERTPECDAVEAVCVAVLYHAGKPEIVCRWTVLFASDSTVGHVVAQSDTSSTYMLRAFAVDAPDAPLLLSGSTPQMPPIALSVHMAGVVRARLFIDPAGSVQGVTILSSSSPMFNQNVVDASKHWKLQPVLVAGQPAGAQVTVEIHFSNSGLCTISLKRAK